MNGGLEDSCQLSSLAGLSGLLKEFRVCGRRIDVDPQMVELSPSRGCLEEIEHRSQRGGEIGGSLVNGIEGRSADLLPPTFLKCLSNLVASHVCGFAVERVTDDSSCHGVNVPAEACLMPEHASMASSD